MIGGITLHEGHRKRLKERFIKEGLTHFEPHQVLELLLFYGIPRKDTNEIAHRLLAHFGSIVHVLDAHPKELQKIPGLSENSSVLLSLIRATTAYYQQQKYEKKEVLDASSKACSFVKNLFITKNYEVFFAIALDNQNRVLHAKSLFEGTTNETAVYPRLIVEFAIRFQASSLIIAHNHPGGSLKPSSADLHSTEEVKNALRTISVKLLDHIIVADANTFSFAENGLL